MAGDASLCLSTCDVLPDCWGFLFSDVSTPSQRRCAYYMSDPVVGGETLKSFSGIDTYSKCVYAAPNAAYPIHYSASCGDVYAGYDNTLVNRYYAFGLSFPYTSGDASACAPECDADSACWGISTWSSGTCARYIIDPSDPSYSQTSSYGSGRNVWQKCVRSTGTSTPTPTGPIVP